mgnify:CR=1 FL=1
MSILDEIFNHKRREVAAQMAELPTAALEARLASAPLRPSFRAALTDPTRPTPRLIAEVKHRSPSKGVLVQPFDPLSLAAIYAANGAAAVSVLTDNHYFGGALDHLSAIARAQPTLPLLRKDFIFDRYQLLQARVAGASAALLIAAMLDDATLARLLAEARTLNLTPLVEIHNRAELDRALDLGADLIGINNRDLHTFYTTLDVTTSLRPYIPTGIPVVAESGIKTAEDVALLASLNIDAMLIGEGLVTARDIAAQVRRFTNPEVA